MYSSSCVLYDGSFIVAKKSEKVTKSKMLAAIRECLNLADGYEEQYMAYTFPSLSEDKREALAAAVKLMLIEPADDTAWALVLELVDALEIL